jgi:hypothetical protein
MDRSLFASWAGRPVPLVTDGGEAGRGGDGSRAALLGGVALGAAAAALPVRLSRDGVPVVLRDPRTGRVAREDLAVAATEAEALRRLRLKGGEPPLFLDEARSLFPPDFPILLLLLVPGAAAASAPLLAGRGETAILSSLREEVEASGRLLPAFPRILRVDRPSLSDGAFCASRSVWVAAAASSLTAVRCSRLRKDGVSFLAHGVETPSLRDRALSLGAVALLSRHVGRLLPTPTP